MPLLAFSSAGRRFPAWSLTSDEWSALKTGYRDLGLIAGCCASSVVPVTSKRGWQFFRHAPGTDCDHRESPEHVVSKTLAARAAEALGYEVTTEASGPGQAWRADVLAQRPEKGWSIALEIQLARCSLDAIERRQARYAADGVRGAWLVGFSVPEEHSPNRDLPLFQLVPHRDGRIDPWVSGPGRSGRQTPLSDFVTLLLSGRVVLHEPPPHTLAPAAVGAPTHCWKCYQPLVLLVSFANAPPGVLAPKGWLPARDLAKVPELLARYRSAVPKLLQAAPDLTVLRPPRRETAGPELRAFCPHCDAPQSLERLPPGLFDPAVQRCWSLDDARAWSPRERRHPHWSWGETATAS